MNENAPDILTLKPALPEGTFDLERALVVYDRVSDELSLYFDGVVRAAANIAIDSGDHDYIYARVDPMTGETVGLQFDGFLKYVIHQHPEAASLLTVAELHGFDDLAAADLRRWARARVGKQADVALSTLVGQLIA